MPARKSTRTSERKPPKRKPDITTETRKKATRKKAAAKEEVSKKKGSKKSAGKPRKLLTPREKVRKSQQTVLIRMPGIVTGMCNAAKGGNSSAAKFAFDFAGISELQSPLEAPSQDSLATLLMKKIDGPDTAKPEPEKSSSTVE